MWSDKSGRDAAEPKVPAQDGANRRRLGRWRTATARTVEKDLHRLIRRELQDLGVTPPLDVHDLCEKRDAVSGFLVRPLGCPAEEGTPPSPPAPRRRGTRPTSPHPLRGGPAGGCLSLWPAPNECVVRDVRGPVPTVRMTSTDFEQNWGHR